MSGGRAEKSRSLGITDGGEGWQETRSAGMAFLLPQDVLFVLQRPLILHVLLVGTVAVPSLRLSPVSAERPALLAAQRVSESRWCGRL